MPLPPHCPPGCTGDAQSPCSARAAGAAAKDVWLAARAEALASPLAVMRAIAPCVCAARDDGTHLRQRVVAPPATAWQGTARLTDEHSCIATNMGKPCVNHAVCRKCVCMGKVAKVRQAAERMHNRWARTASSTHCLRPTSTAASVRCDYQRRFGKRRSMSARRLTERIWQAHGDSIRHSCITASAGY